MSERLPVFVIDFGKESYVQTDYWLRDRLIVNGRRDWPKALGCDDFVVVKRPVKSLERYEDPQRVTTRYTLRSDLVCAKKAQWVTPDEYQRLPESDQLLYSAEIEERAQRPTPLTFTVVDGEAPPREMPQGISPIPPGHVNVRSWFWWTLPCRASSNYVFAALAERVKALDPEQFGVTVYSNIKHLRVEMFALRLGGIEYRPTGYLVHIDRGCSGMEGSNLDDLLAKVAAWCDEKMAPVIAAKNLRTCPACARTLKAGAASLRARNPKYRRCGHDIS